jgi:hypothetical protein
VAQSFGVTPGGVRVTARHLGDVSSAVKDVMASWRDNLAAEGAAWGVDDEIATAFAEGEAGYVAQREWVDRSVDPATTGLLDFYAQALKTAADAAERADQS